jgi:hypothetical protein
LIAFGLPPLRLEIADGDIAAQQTDAVVNAANNAFWMGSGVAGALKARGGQAIETEAMAQGPVEPGGKSDVRRAPAARYAFTPPRDGTRGRRRAHRPGDAQQPRSGETQGIRPIAFPALAPVSAIRDRRVSPGDDRRFGARDRGQPAAPHPPGALRLLPITRSWKSPATTRPRSTAAGLPGVRVKLMNTKTPRHEDMQKKKLLVFFV